KLRSPDDVVLRRPGCGQACVATHPRATRPTELRPVGSDGRESRHGEQGENCTSSHRVFLSLQAGVRQEEVEVSYRAAGRTQAAATISMRGESNRWRRRAGRKPAPGYGMSVHVRVGAEVLEDLLPLAFVQHQIDALLVVALLDAALRLHEVVVIPV